MFCNLAYKKAAARRLVFSPNRRGEFYGDPGAKIRHQRDSQRGRWTSKKGANRLFCKDLLETRAKLDFFVKTP
jgi:hypothetical protein